MYMYMYMCMHMQNKCTCTWTCTSTSRKCKCNWKCQCERKCKCICTWMCICTCKWICVCICLCLCLCLCLCTGICICICICICLQTCFDSQSEWYDIDTVDEQPCRNCFPKTTEATMAIQGTSRNYPPLRRDLTPYAPGWWKTDDGHVGENPDISNGNDFTFLLFLFWKFEMGNSIRITLSPCEPK